MQPPDSSTKKKLLAAAIRLAARDGLAAATTAAIAAEAGFAEGTLYRHYSSKDELLIAAYRKVKAAAFCAAMARTDPSAPIPERFRALWRGLLDAYRADPDAFIFTQRLLESALAAREGGQGGAPIAVVIEQLRADGVARGLVKPLSPELMNSLFYAPLISLLKREAAGHRWREEDLAAAAGAVWDAWKA